jgi:hypothetical protein
MLRIVLPRTAKQAFISLFSFVPALLAADAARRAIRARRGDRAVWALAAGVHAIPGAYFALASVSSVRARDASVP